MQPMFEQLQAMGHQPQIIRGKVFVASMSVDAIVRYTPVSFTRRRYGDTTFCWADAYIRGEWRSLGDPWQAVTPKRSELEREIIRIEGE